MNITITKLEDINLVADLFNAYRMFYGQASDITAATAFLKERLEKNESTIFMAAINGEVVGFVQLYPIFSSVSLRKAWLLNDLFVTENGRKKGVASALLNKAKEYGAETNAKWLMLQNWCR